NSTISILCKCFIELNQILILTVFFD
ncbi:hypothetical protein A5884_002973, partial [Enterococcus sp. 7D2_DIV0200]